MIYIVLVVLSLLIVDYDFDNHCFFSVRQEDSINYMEQDHDLLKVPKMIPAFAPLSQPLKITNLLFETNEHDQVPRRMYEAILNNIEMNPQFEYRFYNHSDRRDFMKSMGDRYLNVYDALLPPAFKADVWRYSVVYHYGGCYTDAGSITTRPLIEMLKPTDQFVSVEDSNGHGVNLAFFCATKGNKVLQYTIDLVFHAVETQNYGRNDLDITGPLKFLQGVRKYLNNPTMMAVPKDYGNGLRLLTRAFQLPCLIALVRDQEEGYVLSKYPSYKGDMKWYTGKEKYGVAWDNRKVFRNNTVQDNKSN